ncbi:MAG: YezD family protein [Verrucomicrobiota bacterium]
MSENLTIKSAEISRHPTEDEVAWLAIIKRQVKSIHFGVVQIVVHNDRVVQIERTEKIRLSDKINQLTANHTYGS